MTKYPKLIILLLMLMPNDSFAQRMRGFDIDGSVLYSDLDNPISFGVSGKYNLWLNPYFAFSFGGRITYSTLDVNFDSPKDKKATYYIEDNNLLNLNADIGIKAATPTFRGVGAFADLGFLFDPIPFNAISVEERLSDSSEKTKNKMVYTHFNPSYSLKLGLLYKLKSRGQIAIGGEISSFNPNNPYYRANIDGIKLKDYLRLIPDKPTYAVFIRFSGIMPK